MASQQYAPTYPTAATVSIAEMCNMASTSALASLQLQTVRSSQPQRRYTWPQEIFVSHSQLQRGPQTFHSAPEMSGHPALAVAAAATTGGLPTPPPTPISDKHMSWGVLPTRPSIPAGSSAHITWGALPTRASAGNTPSGTATPAASTTRAATHAYLDAFTPRSAPAAEESQAFTPATSRRPSDASTLFDSVDDINMQVARQKAACEYEEGFELFNAAPSTTGSISSSSRSCSFGISDLLNKVRMKVHLHLSSRNVKKRQQKFQDAWLTEQREISFSASREGRAAPRFSID